MLMDTHMLELICMDVRMDAQVCMCVVFPTSAQWYQVRYVLGLVCVLAARALAKSLVGTLVQAYPLLMGAPLTHHVQWSSCLLGYALAAAHVEHVCMHAFMQGFDMSLMPKTMPNCNRNQGFGMRIKPKPGENNLSIRGLDLAGLAAQKFLVYFTLSVGVSAGAPALFHALGLYGEGSAP